MEDDLVGGLVVDANVIKAFIEEHKAYGQIYDLINTITDNCGIALTEIIEHEWRTTTGNMVFNIWFDDCLLSEKIKFIKKFKINISADEKKVIHNKYGFPKSRSRDIEYIKCAVNTEIRYILTEDIDFFDPTKKKAPSKEKQQVKIQRKSKFCKFLSKNYDITVGLPIHCCDDLRSKGISIDAAKPES